MVDNDMGYWRAMRNRYWPAYYIVDKKGRVRAKYIGETHKNTLQADNIEATIEKLLAEKQRSSFKKVLESRGVTLFNQIRLSTNFRQMSQKSRF